jgi:hypothetical protein
MNGNSLRRAPVFLTRGHPVDRAWAHALGIPGEALQAPDPRRLAVVRTDNIWLEEPLGAAWVVAYRLSAQQGMPVVAELRVFPAESDRPRGQVGEWSATVLGSRARVPSGGVTARLLRAIRVGAHHRAAGQTFRMLRRALAQSIPEALETQVLSDAFDRHALAGPPMPGRRGVPQAPVIYAALAATYATAIQTGHAAPARLVAERHGLDRARARKALYRARALGLLTKASQGQRGGVLTPKAKRLLRSRGPVHGPHHPRKSRRSRPA